MKRLAASSLLRTSWAKPKPQQGRLPAGSSVYGGLATTVGAAATSDAPRRGIFQYLWRPKKVDVPPPHDPQQHHAHRSQLWGAKTGVGSLNPPPQRATEDLLSKLEKAHYCTQELRGKGTAAASSSSSSSPPSLSSHNKPFILIPTYVPVGLEPPVHGPIGEEKKAAQHRHHRHHLHHHDTAPLRFGEEADAEAEGAERHAATAATAHAHRNPALQQHLDELIAQHFSFRLRRLPSTVPGAGMGLFLTSGRVKEGAVLTCYPGLLYRIPYDLEHESGMDEVSSTPVPPEFLVKNDYLLRFHHEPSDQHFLLDGCPRGVSALNFIRASQRRANQAPPNLDWLESTANACELRPTLGGQGESGRAGQGGQGVTLLPAGPEASDPRKYFTAALGMGHIINDPGDPAAHNAEFHLLELPKFFFLGGGDVAPHLLKYLPNVAYSDTSDRRLVVLVTASREMEVSQGQPPIEIFVPYTQHNEVRPGYPLM